ncbi:MAG TPA: SURF1 family protein [Novosphingobium sp.]|nr:SURF1 family protein [Novosphingobium sp.]
MLRRLPVLPTLIVLAAVGLMIRLGFWQIDRLHQKETMIARYERAVTMSSDVPWPKSSVEVDRALYRHATLDCRRALLASSVSGRNDKAASGWAHQVRCELAGGGTADIVLGWSNDPAVPTWQGGRVYGFVAPSGKTGARLVASPPQAGLAANAHPDPSDLPNNHLAYAVQWFLFAATALVIYILALRKRLTV